jgi:MYXO-CTERM domain-containing protein
MRFSTLGLASLAALLGLVSRPADAATLTEGEPRDSFDATTVVNGLSQPTDVAELPDGRLVITLRLGDVIVLEADGTTQTEAGTISVNPDFGEQGLLGVVADPNFASNNTLYFYASVGNDYENKHKVYKITLSADSMLDSARETVIAMGLRSSKAEGALGNHNGGGLIIHDNMLYVSVGDTGHNATPPTNKLGTCLNSPNGKILRVALDGEIPTDNPLVGQTMVTGCSGWDQDLEMMAPDTRIFAWGFRNPYRFWIDPMTQRMWVGDVGEQAREEIAIGAPVNAAGGDGQHFGWPFHEGTTPYSQSWQPDGACMGVSPARECVPAAYDYGHSSGNNCVIGGLIPSGCGWEAPWTSKYFFGDNGSGRIWTIDVNSGRDGVVDDSVEDFASTSGIGSFRMGAKGALYFAEVSGGTVSKITPKGLNPAMCPGGGSGGMGGTGAGGMGAGGTAGGGNSTGGAGGSSGTGGDTGGSEAGNDGSGGSVGGSSTGGSSTGGSSTGGSSGGTMSTGGTGTGGSSGRGGTGTGGSGVGGSGTAGMGTGGAAPPEEKGSCGCRVAGGGSSYGAMFAGIGALALLGLRRARQRRGKVSRFH